MPTNTSPPPPTPPLLITPGVIATQLRVPIHRVTRILATRTHIQPVAIAGKIRLYLKAAVAQVRHELNAIDARRAAGGRGGKGAKSDAA